MKCTVVGFWSAAVGFILVTQTLPAAQGQTNKAGKAKQTRVSPALIEIYTLQDAYQPDGSNYNQAIKTLQQIQRNAHLKHHSQLEADATHEIETTLKLQKIFFAWQQRARDEIKSGWMGIKPSGIATIGRTGRAADILRQEYHIKILSGYGCMMSREDVAEVNGYTSVMEAEIERRYGKGLVDRVYNRVAKERSLAQLASKKTTPKKSDVGVK